MKIHIGVISVLSLTLATAAFAQTTGGKKQGQIPMPTDEKAILERLHQAHEQEIKLGTLARERASSQQVRDFGQMLVSEHRQADERLMTYAQTKKIKLGEPRPANDIERKLKESSEATMGKLEVLNGEVFDRAFTATMVGQHDLVIAKVQSAQQVATNPQLTNILNESLPRLMQHRDQAYKILGEIKPTPAMGTGGAGSESMPR